MNDIFRIVEKLIKFGDTDAARGYLSWLQYAVENYKIKHNNQGISCVIREDDRLSFTIGNKTVLTLELKAGVLMSQILCKKSEVSSYQSNENFVSEYAFEGSDYMLVKMRNPTVFFSDFDLKQQWLNCLYDLLGQGNEATNKRKHSNFFFKIIKNKKVGYKTMDYVKNGGVPTFEKLAQEKLKLTEYQNLIHEEGFYLHKAMPRWQDFIALRSKYRSEELKSLQKTIKDMFISVATEDVRRTASIFRSLKEDSMEYDVIMTISRLIVYLDLNAYNKYEWNEYLDKRVIARVGVRQDDWLHQMINYLIHDSFDSMTINTGNALRHLTDPIHNLSLLSDKHKKWVSANLLQVEYDEKAFFEQVISFFEPLGIKTKNPQNLTRLYTKLLYDDEIKELYWLFDETENDSEDDILEEEFTDNDNSKTYNMDMKQPLNLILYGPPGTGKTHKLKEYFPSFTEVSYPLSKEEFLIQEIAQMSWWQVIAAALWDKNNVNVPELKNHEFIEIKAKTSSSNNFVAILWGQLQAHTVMECTNVNFTKRAEPLIFEKSEKSIWQIKPERAEIEVPDIIKFVKTYRNYNEKAQKIEIKRYSMVTFHQSYGYEEFIEGIKPDFNESEELRYNLESGVFYQSCISALQAAGFKSFDDYESTDVNIRKTKFEAAPKYLFIIDEINRANISKVFGELITLIEDSKRLGAPDELMVKLPSGRKFGVPKNLYLIGTMNTADRSIALMDIALRRRFAFEEIMPDPSILKQKIDGISLKDMLTKMNERIDYLLDRDHTIGHAFFMSVTTFEDLCNTFRGSIIPLLQEYFYDEWDKIALVLGDNDEWGKKKTERIIQKRETINGKTLFGGGDFDDKEMYLINKDLTVESFIQIYSKP